MGSSEQALHVARIGKPHGIKGEVTVQLFTDTPEERFLKGAQFTCDHKFYPVLTVKTVRWNKNVLLLGFVEASDRNTAEELRNHHLYTAEILEEEDSWYEHELTDMKVLSRDETIGVVAQLQIGDVQDLLIVTSSDGREIMIPFVAEIVTRVDEQQREIHVDLPPGLLELN